jgi:hypothetical protein
LESREFCYLCDQYTETIDHIVATCPYAREVWSLIHQALGRQIPQAAQTVISWWRKLRSSWQGDQRRGVDSLFALVSWQLWKERNSRCFRDAATTPSELLSVIKCEAAKMAGSRHHRIGKSGGTGLALTAAKPPVVLNPCNHLKM